MTALHLALVLAGLSLIYVAVLLVRAYVKYRGARVVTCPETQAPAGVHLDARHAAATVLRQAPDLRLDQCSRWPERAGCGQECLKQIALAPEDCLVRNILTRWYQEKSCVCCNQPLGAINWTEHAPALLSPDRKTLEWSELRAEEVPAVLASHLPICWRCHIVETFRREHPELVLDRSRPWTSSV